MKNLFKTSLFILLIFTLICSFSFFNNINTSYALNSDNIHTVNFYDDNNLLYSVDVYNGQTLNNLKNSNILKNSSFIYNNGAQDLTSSYVNFADYWYNYYNAFVSFDNGLSIDISRDVQDNFFIMQQVNIIPNNTYYFNCLINDRVFSGSVFIPTDFVQGNQYFFYNVNNPLDFGVRVRLQYSSRGSFGTHWYFDIYYGKSGNVDNVTEYNTSQIYLGLNDYSYFDIDYVDQLFKNYNNLTSEDTIYWSTVQSIGQFDFNTPILSDINLYGSTELNYTVNFYSSDRLTVLNSYIMPYGSNLSSIYYDIKQLYLLNNSEFVSLNDFDLVFTDDYYSYKNYFNDKYIILDDSNLYCVAIPNNYDIVDSSKYSSFSNFSMGDNLLNQINIDSIKFNVSEFFPLDDTPLYTLKFTQQNPNIILNTNIYSDFTDYYNNTYYYKIYGYKDNNLYLYDIYLYRVNMTDFEHFCFYPCPPELFIIDNYYMKNFSSFVFYDTLYYFKYDIDFNMNYYYADYFALTVGFTNGSISDDFIYYDTSNRLYNMGSYSTVNPIKGINSSLMLNSYINSFSMNVKSRTEFTGLPVTDNFYYQLFNEVGGLEFYNPKVYYYQSNNQSNGNNIIPTDTSGLYKQKQNWYDFGTDIYNMFIYIIFEAPIISNIAELIYVIVALIINTILTIVGLFSSVKNTIFIAMILGFLLFKFITKKFLGGS